MDKETRQAKFRRIQKDRGLVQVAYWIPVSLKAQVAEYVSRETCKYLKKHAGVESNES